MSVCRPIEKYGLSLGQQFINYPNITSDYANNKGLRGETITSAKEQHVWPLKHPPSISAWDEKAASNAKRISNPSWYKTSVGKREEEKRYDICYQQRAAIAAQQSEQHFDSGMG